MMKHTLDFIMGIEKALPTDVCERLIQKFEENKESHVERNTNFFKFDELEIANNPEFQSECEVLTHSAYGLFGHYKKEIGANFFPPNYVLEGFRMKKYDPSKSQQFDWHADVGDASSAKRFLVIFWYLNTVEEGGETAFDWDQEEATCDISLPIQGNAIIFPPMWMFPHKGMPPVSGPKYIVSTYAHYT
jgi:prolyl 4-hydroxylase